MTTTRPLRLILHAGLHKSGTTTIQLALRAAYGTPAGGVWFPLMDDPGYGHELIVWTMRGALQETRRDLPESAVPAFDPVHLGALIERAAAQDVEVLVISAEGFDVATPAMAAALRTQIGALRTTLLITATTPVHRWFSMWQERVKHGASARPLDDSQQLGRTSLTSPDALARQVDLLPHDELVVRLVRTAPPEHDLTSSVLAACGVDPAEGVDDAPPANRGFGPDIELLRRLNALGITAGQTPPERLARLATFRAVLHRTPWAREPRAEYGVPDWFPESARREQRWLRELAGRGDATLLDPHDELDGWAETSIPDWITELACSEWPDVPDADARSWPATT